MPLKKTILLISIILITLLLIGCTQTPVPAQKPIKEGIDCENSESCLTLALVNCDKAFATLPQDNNSLIFMQVIGVSDVNGKCMVYLQLVGTGALPSFFKGLDATCKLTLDEALILKGEMNITDYDCKGILYETVKQVKQIS